MELGPDPAVRCSTSANTSDQDGDCDDDSRGSDDECEGGGAHLISLVFSLLRLDGAVVSVGAKVVLTAPLHDLLRIPGALPQALDGVVGTELCEAARQRDGLVEASEWRRRDLEDQPAVEALCLFAGRLGQDQEELVGAAGVSKCTVAAADRCADTLAEVAQDAIADIERDAPC